MQDDCMVPCAVHPIVPPLYHYPGTAMLNYSNGPGIGGGRPVITERIHACPPPAKGGAIVRGRMVGDGPQKGPKPVTQMICIGV